MGDGLPVQSAGGRSRARARWGKMRGTVLLNWGDGGRLLTGDRYLTLFIIDMLGCYPSMAKEVCPRICTHV